MKKLSVLFCGLLLLASCANNANKATVKTEEVAKQETAVDLSEFKNIKLLPADVENSSVSLMSALQNRQSQRNFNEEMLTLEDLSNVLWAAYGINREDGKRTVPSAVALYPVKVYAVLSNGIYFYNAENNELEAVAEGDFRSIQGQAFSHNAPLNILYIADMNKYDNSSYKVNDETAIKFAMSDASHSSQNVYLYCAGFGLKTVIRGGGFDEATIRNVLNLDNRHFVLLAQTVGY
jgi:SagB-type dehydrogenase family enzyme